MLPGKLFRGMGFFMPAAVFRPGRRPRPSGPASRPSCDLGPAGRPVALGQPRWRS